MKWLALVLLLLVGCATRAPAPDRVTIDCGTETRTHPQRGANAEGRKCIWDAYSNRAAATFAVTRYTLEGDPIILKLSVISGKIQASVDTRQDQFSAKADRKVTEYTCKTMRQGMDVFVLEGCTGGEATALHI